MKLVVASSNSGKLAEFRDLLGAAGYDFVPQSELGVSDVEETGLTFGENALLKARNAAHATGLPARADDCGLCVDALGGAPGLYSARYAGTPSNAHANIAKLLEELRDVPPEQRTGHHSIRFIGKKLGMHRNTVKKFIEGRSFPPYDRGKRGISILAPFVRFILDWLSQYDYRASWVFEKLKQIGYQGLRHGQKLHSAHQKATCAVGLPAL